MNTNEILTRILRQKYTDLWREVARNKPYVNSNDKWIPYDLLFVTRNWNYSKILIAESCVIYSAFLFFGGFKFYSVKKALAFANFVTYNYSYFYSIGLIPCEIILYLNKQRVDNIGQKIYGNMKEEEL